MGDASSDALKARVLDALENRIRPRDEVLTIRRLMALQLGRSIGEEQLSGPPSLVRADAAVPSAPQQRQGLQRMYVEAVKRNLQVRSEFAKLQQQQRGPAPLAEKDGEGARNAEDSEKSLLDLHLEVTELRQRHDKLSIILGYMAQLERQPVGAPDFLDPKVVYKDCGPLPEVPKELLDGFAANLDASSDAEVQELLQKLKKTVLRNKLVARKEDQRLQAERNKDPVETRNLSPQAKLDALNAVKNALINWIESQLSRAGDGNNDEEDATDKDTPGGLPKVDLGARLGAIQKEYERHVELRKQVLALVAKRRQTQTKELIRPPEAAGTDVSLPPKPTPLAYLLTPYIESLQVLAREQKSAIEEKSHANTTLAKQQADAKMTLDHVAEESQLLPKYPSAKSSSQRDASFGEATRSAGRASATKQVEPWIYAADSAKIAMLETVAEKVEEGMISVEEARGAIQETCHLLAVDLAQEDAVKENEEGSASSAKKQHDKGAKGHLPKTVWSGLDGTLGSIRTP